MKQQIFHLEEFHRDVPDEALLADLVRVQSESRQGGLSFRRYNAHGKYSSATVALRFGTWNNALERAGLIVSARRDYSESELFENLFAVWCALGRQPRTRDLSLKPSTITVAPYLRVFGTWTKTLNVFVEWTSTKDEVDVQCDSGLQSTKQGPRNPSTRLRFKVLQRDSFKCVSCGNSPAIQTGIVLHVDHILPWSKGGQTIESNLQTLCQICNLGKSNAL
jgi:hypothetical protein